MSLSEAAMVTTKITRSTSHATTGTETGATTTKKKSITIAGTGLLAVAEIDAIVVTETVPGTATGTTREKEGIQGTVTTRETAKRTKKTVVRVHVDVVVDLATSLGPQLTIRARWTK